MAKGKSKSNIWIDSIFATAFIYIFMYIISNISAFKIFDAFDSVGQALQDMEMTDIAFSQMRDQPKMEDKVLLVNIGNLSRSGIARQIRILDKYNPRVIAIDSFFKGYLGDTLGTLNLASAITSTKSKVVMVAKVEQSDSLMAIHEGDEIYDELYLSDSLFLGGNVEVGIANLDTEAAYQQDVKICRQFPSYRTLTNGETYIAFGAKMAEAYDSTSVEELLKRDNAFETINYRGDFYNFFDPDSTELTRFAALDYDQVLNEDFVPSFIKDKVIIMGYIGDDFLDLYSWEDKFFTPLNKKIAGRATPDMYGPVIHANIASMILNHDYVDSFSETTDNILGLILCFLNVLLFSYIYRTMGAWYDGVTKLIQVIEVIVILFLIVYLFSWISFKLELTIGLFAIALAGDLLEVYYGVIKNIFSKKSINKVFKLVKRKNSDDSKVATES